MNDEEQKTVDHAEVAVAGERVKAVLTARPPQELSGSPDIVPDNVEQTPNARATDGALNEARRRIVELENALMAAGITPPGGQARPQPAIPSVATAAIHPANSMGGRFFMKHVTQTLERLQNSLSDLDDLMNVPKSPGIELIPLSKLRTTQQRGRNISYEKSQDLKRNIQQYGLVHPILVRPLESGEFEVISGKNRLNAMIELRHSFVPGEIREVDFETAEMMAFSSNFHSGGLTAGEIQEWLAYQSARTGKSPELIADEVDLDLEIANHHWRVYQSRESTLWRADSGSLGTPAIRGTHVRGLISIEIPACELEREDRLVKLVQKTIYDFYITPTW